MSISLKELKKNRLTPPEKYVLDLIEGVEPRTSLTGDVAWDKDGKWLFTQDFKTSRLYVSYINIWNVLYKEFGLNDDEIFELLTNTLYDYTDNGKLTVKHDW